MEYLIGQDIESVLEILGYSMDDFAKDMGVSRVTVSNWVNGKTAISERHLSDFYAWAFKKGIRLNKIKEQLYREYMDKGEDILLFHGAKTEIDGPLDLSHNKDINDFGNGFYCGESLEQSAMFVASYKKPSLYMAKFSPNNLVKKEFAIDQEWILTVAYFRGHLKRYANSSIVKRIAKAKEGIDYIVAPIADNRIFEIMSFFLDGEITDIQCQHCLSATNLGEQYILVSEKALKQVELLERCYLANNEKEAYLRSREQNYLINMDKVKLARKQYANKGKYIEDILL